LKIAYLIIAHNEPENVFNLVRTLHKNDVVFFIHFKKGVLFEVPPDILNLGNVLFAKERYLAGWCGFNVIRANMHLLELACNQSSKFDYYINLSGNCFPIHSNEYISNYLLNNPFNFIEGEKLPSERLHKLGLSKIEFPWFQDELQKVNPYFKKYFHKSLHAILNFFKIKRKFPERYHPYFGSQWWALTHEAVGILIISFRNEKKLVNFFKQSWCADEQYMQTVIFNSILLKDKIRNQTFRYIDWNSNGPPKILTIEDSKKILSSGKLFMRKIDLIRSAGLIELLRKNQE
jgi:hypothetical protein